MIIKHNISSCFSYPFASLRSGLWLVWFLIATYSVSSQSVIVNAGPDQTICKSDSLFLPVLNAQITGLVNDGYWFTTGDGYFLPSFDDNVQFSVGSVYVPGPSDKITGGFNLILVSFDPDGFGPLVQVSDDVHITLMGNIAMVCNSNLNIALGPDCSSTFTHYAGNQLGSATAILFSDPQRSVR
ncbi:MAG: hypothetical protein IPO65_18760 [Saprospiraceae bacterium]|nr:hypothetical protein [Saprospiraceae bacterium]